MEEKLHQDPEHGAEVKISVNDKQYVVHRGHQTVAHIKEVAGVPAAEELEQVIEGKFTPLSDDGAVTIKGGEIFISHVRHSSGS